MKVRVWDPNNAWKYDVDRNWLQRLFYPKDFATLGEAIRRYNKAAGISWWDKDPEDWFLRIIWLLVIIPPLLFLIYGSFK